MFPSINSITSLNRKSIQFKEIIELMPGNFELASLCKSNRQLSFEEKRTLCRYHKTNPLLSQSSLAQWAKEEFKLENPLSQSTVSCVLSKHRVYESMTGKELNAKRQRKLRHPEIDEALIQWIHQCTANNMRLSYDLIREKAS